MDKRIKNIVGQKFGRLTVIKYLYSKKHKPYWLCQCDCGNEYVACYASHLFHSAFLQ